MTTTDPDITPGPRTTTEPDTLSVNTIRGLCMDAIQKASSGHPGTPLGIAPVTYTRWPNLCWIYDSNRVTIEGHTDIAFTEDVAARFLGMPPDEDSAPGAAVAIEQASTLGWDRYVGDGGAVVGMHTFGASAPLEELLTKFGFTPGQVAQVARERVLAAAGSEGREVT